MKKVTKNRYIVQGDFAEQLAKWLSVESESITNIAEIEEFEYGDDSPVVFIHEGAPLDYINQLDYACWKASSPLLPLQLSPTRITCGPLIVPRKSACFLCYSRRYSQHSPDISFDELADALNGLEPGFAPHHIVVAAGLLKATISDNIEKFKENAGLVRTVNLVTGLPSQSLVVPVHNCERCSDTRVTGAAKSRIPDSYLWKGE